MAQRPDELKRQVREYWSQSPNALRKGAPHRPGTIEFLEKVYRHRYSVEPCVEEMAQFDRWAGLRVLEVGCGIGLDALRFARAGAEVTAVDFSLPALRVAQDNARLMSVVVRLVLADAENLPFHPETFDLVYSHGVLHHTPDTRRAVAEVYRVLKPGGTAIVMLYHRGSYFARFLIPWVVRPAVLAGLALYRLGLRGLLRRLYPDRVFQIVEATALQGYSFGRVLTMATDYSSVEEGVVNPLSQFYTREEARELFGRFSSVRLETRQLYHFPPAPRAVKRRVERSIGDFLYIIARK